MILKKIITLEKKCDMIFKIVFFLKVGRRARKENERRTHVEATRTDALATAEVRA